MKYINKILVGVDMDSVLTSSEISYCDLFNELTGEHLKPSDLINYNTTKVVPKQYAKLAAKLWEIPELYDRVQPVENAQRYTKILSMNPDIELFIPTVAKSSVMERKVEYINKEFPWIPEDHIIFISNKQLLNINILIEDNEKQLLGGSYKKILLSSPWNQNFNAEYNGIVRCDSWDEIYKEVMRIVGAKQQIYELMN